MTFESPMYKVAPRAGCSGPSVSTAIRFPSNPIIQSLKTVGRDEAFSKAECTGDSKGFSRKEGGLQNSPQ